MLKLIIFDLDGTLVDSLWDLTDAVNYMRSRFALPPLSLEEVRALVGEGAKRLVEGALPGFDPESLRQGLEHFLDFNFRHIADKSVLYPDVAETLQLLKNHGYILAIASNKSEALCKEIMRLMGADHLFSEILGADSLAERKPSPMPIFHLMDLFGAHAGETMMVGDSINDMLAGKAAGVLTIGCDYGYGTPEELRASDRIILSIREIVSLLPKHESSVPGCL